MLNVCFHQTCYIQLFCFIFQLPAYQIDLNLSVCPQQKAQLEDEVQDHILTPLSDLPKYDPATSTLNQFWHAVSQMKLPSGSLQFQQLYQLNRVLLTLPHSNTDTEHVFSMLKKIQTDSRDNLSDQTIHRLLSVTIQQCHQYKPDTDVVKAVKKACTSYLNQCASAKQTDQCLMTFIYVYFLVVSVNF